MKTLVKKISEKLVEFGLNNICNDTVVTVDPQTKEVSIFNSEMNSFKNDNGQFIELFCASQFVYEVSEGLYDVNTCEIKNQTCIIE